MSDLILSLPYCYRHIAVYVVQIINIILGRRGSRGMSAHPIICASPYVSFPGFALYIAVLCGFDKHSYLTSWLNAHIHNTCIHLL